MRIKPLSPIDALCSDPTVSLAGYFWFLDFTVSEKFVQMKIQLTKSFQEFSVKNTADKLLLGFPGFGCGLKRRLRFHIHCFDMYMR